MLELTTKVWKMNNDWSEHQGDIQEVANLLRGGKVIAIPTETVYGLGANALDSNAVKKIFEAKGRPSDNPLIVHIATLDQLDELVTNVSDISRKLIDAFWPGPLTLVFHRKEGIPNVVTAGLSSVAVRMPAHPITLNIIKTANIPIAAPSANRSGKPSPTTAEHVLTDLKGLIDGIVDGGATGIGVESTVIDVSEEYPTILRPGGVTIEEIESVIGKVNVDPALINKSDKPKSPGMKYKHYAPQGFATILSGNEKRVVEEINHLAKKAMTEGKKVGILTLEEHEHLIDSASLILSYGTKDNLYPLAEHLYDALRTFDHHEINVILIEGVEERGIGLTIMNRLKKAASGNILYLK